MRIARRPRGSHPVTLALTAVLVASLLPISGGAASTRPIPAATQAPAQVDEPSSDPAVEPAADPSPAPAASPVAAPDSDPAPDPSAPAARPDDGTDPDAWADPAQDPSGGPFDFSWRSPVQPRPRVNRLSAGGLKAIRFSLGGTRGLSVIAPGFPVSQGYDCETGRLLPLSRYATRPFGAAGLTFNPTTRVYTYTWRTREEWSGTCRRFVLKLSDGSVHQADFRIDTFRFITPTRRFPAVNQALPGAVVPVRFRLGRNARLDIFAGSTPRSAQVDCATDEPIGGWTQALPRGKAGLTRNPRIQNYRYAWQTQAEWAETCRRFEMRMKDGTVQVLRFRFSRPPDAVADGGVGFTTDEATAFTTADVLANDSHPDGRPFSLTDVDTAGTDGSVTSNGDGTFGYDPDGRFESLGSGEQGTDTFRYTITDSDGASDGATVTITIDGLNDAPVIDDQARSVSEDASKGANVGAPVSFTDVDATDGHTFAITGGNGAGAFAIDPSTGQITVDDASQLDHATTPSYTLTVEVTDDGAGALSDSATVTVNVTDVNDAPQVDDDTFSVSEAAADGTDVGSPVSFTDPDAVQGHTFSITAGNTGGAFRIDASSGQIEVDDAAQLDHETRPSYTLTVQVLDDGSPALSGSATITVNVTDVNEAPVVDADTFGIPEDSATDADVGTVTFSDQDLPAQGHAFSITAGNTGGAFRIDASTGLIEVDDASELDHETRPSYALTVQVTDDGAGALSGTATITVNVTNVNEAPVNTLPASYLALPDGSTPGDPDDWTANLTGISIADPDAGSATVSVTLTVSSGTLQVRTDVASGITAGQVTGNGTASVTLTAPLAAMDTTLANPTGVVYHAATAPLTSVTFQVTTNDLGNTGPGGARSDTDQAAIVFDNTPVANAKSVTATEDTLLPIVLTASDDDDDGLTFDVPSSSVNGGTLAAVGSPDCSATDTCSQTFDYTPAANSTAADSFDFTVTDGVTSSSPATVSITITPVNDAPVITLSGSAPSWTEGASPVTVDGSLTISDVDNGSFSSATIAISAGAVSGDSLAFTSAGHINSDTNADPTILHFSVSDTASAWESVLRSVRFSSTSDDPGTTRTISFVISDGSAPSTTVFKSVTVVPVNDAPTLTATGVNPKFFEGDPAQDLFTTVTASAVEPGQALDQLTLGVTNVSGGTDETLSIDGTVVELTNGNSETTATNGMTAAVAVASGTATVTVAKTGGITPAQLQTLVDALAYQNTSQDPTATARVVTLTSLRDTGGTANGGADTATLSLASSVDVVPLNDAPAAADLTFDLGNAAIGNTSLVIDDATDAAPDPAGVQKTITGDPLGGASDVDTPSSLWSLTAETVTNAAGSLVVQADGDMTYLPAAGFSGDAVFSYTLNDNDPAGNASDTGTITINVPATPRVWYIDSAATPGGDGTSDGPFDALADVTGATGPDAAGDILYLATGSYTGGITLLNTQTLQGAGSGLVVSATLLATAGTDPVIANAAGNGVTLASGNTLTGFTVGDTTGFDIANTATATVGPLAIGNVVLNGSGGLFRADSGGTLDVRLESASTSAAGATGILIAGGATGSFRVTGATTINDATSDGIAITGSAVSTAFGKVTILNDGVGANGDGVDLSTNTGTYGFEGGVDITVNGAGAFAFRAQSSTSVTFFNPSGTNQLTSNAGTALLVSSTFLSATFASVTSGGGSEGISLASLTGGSLAIDSVAINGQTGDGVDITSSSASVTISGGAIGATNDPAGIGVDINGGTLPITIDASIAKTTAGRVVEVSGRTGGTVDFNGAISSSGSGGGIDLASNTGGMVRFDGGMNLSTGANPAFSSTVSPFATVVATQNNTSIVNTLTTTTGTALNIANTSIGSEGLTFRSISSNGAASGIVLITTGSFGGLTVTGNSSGSCGGSVSAGPPAAAATVTAPVTADCTGGTIQASTGAGIVLTNTRDVSLTRIRLLSSGNDGVQASNVTGFSLISSYLDGNGNALNENNLDFGDSSSGTPDGLHGTGAITSSTIQNAYHRNVSVRNSSGSALTAFTITGSQFRMNPANGDADDNLLIEAGGTASMTASVTSSYFASTEGDHVQAAALNAGSVNVTLTTNTLTGGHSTPLGQGITINAATGVPGWTGSVVYDVNGNNIQGAASNAISAVLGTSASTATFTGKVRGNVIGTSGVALSCSSQANGVYIDARGNGTHTSSVTGNTIRRCFDRGILTEAGDGDSVLNLTVTGNTIDQQLDPGAREAIQTNFGITSTNVFLNVDSNTVCLQLGGAGSLANTFSHGDGAPDDFRLRKRQEATVRLPGYAGGTGQDATALGQVVAYVQGQNNGSGVEPGSAAASGAGGGYTGGSACPTPP